MIDLHMHTGYSDDAEPHTVEQKALAAIGRGLKIIAITDHFEFFRTSAPVGMDIATALRDMRAVKQAMGDRLELLCGIEIGQPFRDDNARELLLAFSFDTVIGSLHTMPNDVDIYFHDFGTLDCDRFLHDYFDELMKLIRYGGFDVLAHIDYPLRVMRHGDYVPSFDHYMDRVLEVLEETVLRGYALEINAAGLGGWQKKVGPAKCILEEYKRLGGTRISIGSDSHSLETVGRGIDECIALAKSAGFHEVTVFRSRQPAQVEI